MNSSKTAGGRSTRGRELSIWGFLLRLAAALVLVFATYNPTGYSFYDWARTAFADGGLGPEHVLAGVLIVIGWTIFIVASIRSLGALGLTLATAFFAALVWLLIDFGLLRADSATAITWIILICMAGLLAIGVSWSLVWRRLTGQYEVDED